MRHVVAQAVLAELQRSGRSPQWLEERSGVPLLAEKLAEHEDFTVVDLAGIAAALSIPIVRLTP